VRSVTWWLFAALLGTHVLLADKPETVNYAVLLHIASLLGLLAALFARCAIAGRFPMHPFSVWIVTFVGYFFVVGASQSLLIGAPWVDVVKFPYRISNLLIALLLPSLVRSRKDVVIMLRMALGLVVLHVLRDLGVGFWQHGSGVLGVRLWSDEYRSLLFLAAFGVFVGWSVAEWSDIRKHPLLLGVFAASGILVLLKLVLVYSRTVWFAILPVNLMLLLWVMRRQELRGVRRPVMVGVGVALAAALVVAVSSDPVRELTKERYGLLGHSYRVKTDEFRAILSASEDALLFGKGFGHHEEFYKGGFYRNQDYVHNLFLQFLLSSGVVGLSLLVWGLLLLMRHV
jgi:O-antigen ligase